LNHVTTISPKKNYAFSSICLLFERIIPFQFLDTSNNQLDPTISMLTFNIGTIIIPTTQLLFYQAIHTRNCEAQFSSSTFSHAIAIAISTSHI
jgi:hypothetical protein